MRTIKSDQFIVVNDKCYIVSATGLLCMFVLSHLIVYYCNTLLTIKSKVHPRTGRYTQHQLAAAASPQVILAKTLVVFHFNSADLVTCFQEMKLRLDLWML